VLEALTSVRVSSHFPTIKKNLSVEELCHPPL
jgi:hypothetical protein